MPKSDTKRETQRRKKGARRAKIIAAAKQHFALRGFDGASTRQIATEADVAQSLLLYYFATKEDLWKAVMDDRFAEANEVLGWVDARQSMNAREQLTLFVRSFVAFCAKDADLHRLMTLAARAKDDRLKWLVQTHLRPSFELVRALITEGQKEGWVRPGDPTLLYYSVLAIAGTTYSSAPEIELLDPTTSALIPKGVERLILSTLFAD